MYSPFSGPLPLLVIFGFLCTFIQAGGMPKLAEMGGIQGLAEAFRTSLENGIYADEEKEGFAVREAKYELYIYCV